MESNDYQYSYICEKIVAMYYSGTEIIEIALRVEENGQAFYTAAADAIGFDNDTRRLFLDLAEKELLHVTFFQRLEKEFEAETFEFKANEESAYINFFADNHIFGQAGSGFELAKTLSSPHEALEIALKFENDSVKLYTELEKRTSGKAKPLIHQIIEEEKTHAEEIQRFLS